MGMALHRVETMLREAGLPEGGLDARILLEEATGLGRAPLLLNLDEPLGPASARRLGSMLARRLAREPVFRIIGHREFWGLDLLVTPAVLDPRPDTETVVSAALEALGDRKGEPRRVLDLGTGSGAILLALLTELPEATGLGVDRSAEACAVARSNAERCGLADRVTILERDFGDPLGERFDLIVSNPPYIESAAVTTLDPEVRDHDPLQALDGGADGLDAYRALAPVLQCSLASEGTAVLEVGAGQAAAVSQLLSAAGLNVIDMRRDLGGHDRAVVAK